MAGGIIDESHRVTPEAKVYLQGILADYRAKQAEEYRAWAAEDRRLLEVVE